MTTISHPGAGTIEDKSLKDQPALHTLKINKAFNDLLPPLSHQELGSLESSILKHGCFNAITIWGGVIIDGHARYEVCQKHNIPFQVPVSHTSAPRSFSVAATADSSVLNPA